MDKTTQIVTIGRAVYGCDTVARLTLARLTTDAWGRMILTKLH
jgi:hypothetical protein